MKGQLFQIKDGFDNLMLLWCSDPYITSDSIQSIVNKWWHQENEDDEADNEILMELLEEEYRDQGITFERVYTEIIRIE